MSSRMVKHQWLYQVILVWHNQDGWMSPDSPMTRRLMGCTAVLILFVVIDAYDLSSQQAVKYPDLDSKMSSQFFLSIVSSFSLTNTFKTYLSCQNLHLWMCRVRLVKLASNTRVWQRGTTLSLDIWMLTCYVCISLWFQKREWVDLWSTRVYHLKLTFI